MLGSHLSIAGGMANALHEAARLKMDCVQVFTKNQRQWSVPPMKAEERDEWLRVQKSMGWHRLTGPVRVVSHNSYLINMASPDAPMRRRSIALQRDELERCEMLRIRLCVAHPGARMGTPRKPGEPNRLGEGISRAEVAGLRRIVKSLDQIHRDLPGYRAVTCLETTVGSGTNLGYDFAHLAFIREHVREPERVGFCLDTCHVTAAGYSMRTAAEAKAVMQAFDRTCGLANLKALHLNDSVGEVGSRRDRHAHIGDGHCGTACFAEIMNRTRLRSVPKILETPKGDTQGGTEWDRVNIRRLNRLIRRSASSR